MRRWAPQVRSPKFCIWTSKIIPDLRLPALFWLIKKITPPYCRRLHLRSLGYVAAISSSYSPGISLFAMTVNWILVLTTFRGAKNRWPYNSTDLFFQIIFRTRKFHETSPLSYIINFTFLTIFVCLAVAARFFRLPSAKVLKRFKKQESCRLPPGVVFFWPESE